MLPNRPGVAKHIHGTLLYILGSCLLGLSIEISMGICYLYSTGLFSEASLNLLA